MDKLSVSYYMPESLVMKIESRCAISGNRSKQICDDLRQFYDMLDYGLKTSMKTLDASELKLVIQAIHARPFSSYPSLSVSRTTLVDIVSRFSIDAECVASKIESFDNITCYALFDWARTNI